MLRSRSYGKPVSPNLSPGVLLLVVFDVSVTFNMFVFSQVVGSPHDDAGFWASATIVILCIAGNQRSIKRRETACRREVVVEHGGREQAWSPPPSQGLCHN